MAVPVLFYWLIAYGLFGMLVIIGIMNFLFGGLLGPFFKVKSSRGKKILVIIRNPVQDYFKAGEVNENHLVFKDREKDTRRIPMEHGVVSRRAGIFWCEIDDEKSCFFRRDDGKGVMTYDAKKTDSLLLRALYKPTLQDDIIPKVTLVLVIVALLAVIVTAVLVYRQGQKIDLVMSTLDMIRLATHSLSNNATVI